MDFAETNMGAWTDGGTVVTAKGSRTGTGAGSGVGVGGGGGGGMGISSLAALRRLLCSTGVATKGTAGAVYDISIFEKSDSQL